MAFVDNLQYRVENLSLYFQGGVRRGILIFAGICLILLPPTYFLGQFTSSVYQNFWFDNINPVNERSVTVSPYRIGETQIVPLSNGSKDLYVSVLNKENRDIGFFPWVYTLQVLNAQDQLLSQERITSYLLPDETKFIVARSSDPNAAKLRLIEEPGTQSVLYNPAASQTLTEPDIEIRQQSITPIDDNNLRIFAQFKNNDIVNIQSMQILYIVRDTRQSVVGIGTFQINGFLSQEIRDFQLTYPLPESREPRFLDIRWSVNYLDETNIRTAR